MVDGHDCQDKTDEELVSLALASKEHFLCLMRRYEDKLMRYVRRLSGAALQDAEDIVQETFLKAYLNLNGFDRRLKFSSWIYRIAHNETISHFRRLKARPQISDLEDDAWQNLASGFNLKKQTESSEVKRDLQRVLAALDEKYRAVLVLKYLEGLDYSEMSDVLRKPVGTVGTLLNRAKTKFQAKARELNIEF
jgi:RNA polymerase sigma-70 factor (ECF subfamily)